MSQRPLSYPLLYLIHYLLRNPVANRGKKTAVRAGRVRKSGWNPQRRRPEKRRKISTTIAPESYAFLEKLIASGEAENLAEAMDLVLEELRRADNRERLERMTAEAYENMSPEAIAEEKVLVEALSQSIGEISFDE